MTKEEAHKILCRNILPCLIGEWREAISIATKALEAESHWIPVTERTPRKRDHKDDMVLVCNENGSIRFNTCINGTWVYGDPIAWMPLPEPYKGVTT